jgi:hypothetical protein
MYRPGEAVASSLWEKMAADGEVVGPGGGDRLQPSDQYAALRENIALQKVLEGILVGGRGPRRKIIDGNHRKAIADELGYECP